jgi:low temperature requirement protein LtrA
MVTPRRVRIETSGERASVTPLELFFDLVFVFALTQVTSWLTVEPTVTNVGRGILILAVMWWSWVGYAWLGNVVRADEGVVRVGMFVAMAALFVGAIAIPEAFGDRPGGLAGPVVFAVCYFLVRAVHVALFWVASRDDRQLRTQVVRWTPSVLAGTVLLLVASQTTGTVQSLLWLAALLGDYLGTLLVGTRWRLNSPSHFAERHALITIVALGESIVSIGIGVATSPISWPIIVGSALGLTVSAALWWAYFDVTALIAERALGSAQGAQQIRLARGGYSFLHLPMVVGVIVMAVGLKKVLSYVGGEGGHVLADPISGVPLVCLYGGAALYLLTHVAFKWYVAGLVNRERIVVVALILVLVPLVTRLPALLTLTMLALVLTALIAWETRQYAEERHQVRHSH